METRFPDPGVITRHARLFTTLQGLLAIAATDVRLSLQQASQVVVDALGADTANIFVYEPAVDTLVALGTSNTPMGRRQLALGLNRVPLSNGGTTGRVFQTGESYRSGHLDQDEDDLGGITQALGVCSAMVVALDVDGTRRGAIQVDSVQVEQFTVEDLRFLEAVAHWVGLVLHRAELVERLAHDTPSHDSRCFGGSFDVAETRSGVVQEHAIADLVSRAGLYSKQHRR